MSNPFLVILVATAFQATHAVCPHEDTDLEQWPIDVGTGDTVQINSKVLLNTSLSYEFDGIEIEDGGVLVFAPNIAGGIVLKTHYIRVKDGGRMDIGSSDCRYQGSLNIQLLGNRNTTIDIPKFGDKFIGVEEGGSLNIYGEAKTSWTSLASTLQKMDDAGFAYDHQVTQDDNVQGFIVYRFDPTQSSFEASDVNENAYNFKTSSQSKFNTTVTELESYLNDVPEGWVVVAAVRKSLMAQTESKNFDSLYNLIESFLGLAQGEAKIRSLKFYDGYVMYRKKGDTSPGQEAVSEYRYEGLHQECQLTIFEGDLKFFVYSYTRIKAHGQSFIEVEVTLKSYSEPTIHVAEHSFAIGDKILIAPTSSDPGELEYASVTQVIDDTHVKIDLTARYDHLCTENTGVRKCAEVALINRNVRIEGVTFGEDLYGGNIKCLNGFTECKFVDFELYLMGQQFPIGRYPIHFHLAGDVTDKALVESLSIHDTYARCVTVHRTNNLIVRNNVCYNPLGHGYFLEDGDEIGNVFTNNLVVGPVKPVDTSSLLIPSDKKPSGFFITHPNNQFDGNHAVGSESHGFYLVFPTSPMGTANPLNNLEDGEASRTNIALFTNNVAHSNLGYGIRMDDYLDAEGEIRSNNGYNARSTPTTETSDLVETQFSCLTAYSNHKANIHIRASKVALTNMAVADSKRGITLLRGINNERFVQTVDSSVIRGQRSSASDEEDENDTDYRVGLEITGPVSLSNLYFDDFFKSTVYRSGAIGFVDGNWKPITGNEIGSDVFFGFIDQQDGNRFLEPDIANDGSGNLVESIYDGSGDIANSNSPVTVLRSTAFQTTGNCYERENWGSYSVCEENYQMVSMNKNATIRRVDSNGNIVDLPGVEAASNTPFNVIIDQSEYHYLFNIDHDFDSSANIKMIGGNAGRKTLGCCVPVGATLKVQDNPTKRFTQVNNYADLESVTENSFFLNETIGIVFFTIIGEGEDDCDSTFDASGTCRTVKVKVTNDITGNNDCFSAATQYTPPSPPTKRRLGEKRLKTMASAEKRILELIEKLESLTGKTSGASKRAVRKARSVSDPEISFPASATSVPSGYGLCSAGRK
ncbi:cell surface hyaluronidase CEMIP2-like [Argopecten irradians]|uniref:cell surface hyaluronidase CEMIP2-like n=1 Tax=Argopecten irradians TaxID=31199 RepID=UPI003716859D